MMLHSNSHPMVYYCISRSNPVSGHEQSTTAVSIEPDSSNEVSIDDSDELYESFDSNFVANPCDGIGMLIRLAIQGAQRGLEGIVDCGNDVLCKKPKEMGCNGEINMSSSLVSSSPHPNESQQASGPMEMMDELHENVNDEPGGVGRVKNSEVRRDISQENNEAAREDEAEKNRDGLLRQQTQAQQHHQSEKHSTIILPLNSLNESAITKDSCSVRILPGGSFCSQGFAMIGEEEANTTRACNYKNIAKKLSFEINSEGMLISGEVDEELKVQTAKVRSDRRDHAEIEMRSIDNAAVGAAPWKVHADNRDDTKTHTTSSKTKAAAGYALATPPLGEITNKGSEKMKKLMNGIKITFPPNVTVGSRKDSAKPKKVSPSSKKKYQKQQQHKTSSNRSTMDMNQPIFVADFASDVAIDSMGFPDLTCVPDTQRDVILSTHHPDVNYSSDLMEKTDEVLEMHEPSGGGGAKNSEIRRVVSKEGLVEAPSEQLVRERQQAHAQQQYIEDHNKITLSCATTIESKDAIGAKSLIKMVKNINPLKNLNLSTIDKDSNSVSIPDSGSYSMVSSMVSKEKARNKKAVDCQDAAKASDTSSLNREAIIKDSLCQKNNNKINSEHVSIYGEADEEQVQTVKVKADRRDPTEIEKRNNGDAAGAAVWKIHADIQVDATNHIASSKTKAATVDSLPKLPLGTSHARKGKSLNKGSEKAKELMNEIRKPCSIKVKDDSRKDDAKFQKVTPDSKKNKDEKQPQLKISSPDCIMAPSQPNFAADFAGNVALDSMGFPDLTSGPCSAEKPSWKSNFTEDNPFATEARGRASPTKTAETKTCAYCHKGGGAAADLKLCSACRSTYYCSHECQSRDWIGGHSKTCKPACRHSQDY